MDTYEKKYKEAMERAEVAYKDTDRHIKATIERIFPELRESEDERMMREFNDWLCEEIEWRTNDVRDEKDRITLNMLRYVLTKVKDWLEKQKEQGPQEPQVFCEAKAFDLGYKQGKEDAKKELKPAWNEEDERILKGIIGKIDHDQTYGVSKDEMLNFLKKL